jgi:hypothetical protein
VTERLTQRPSHNSFSFLYTYPPPQLPPPPIPSPQSSTPLSLLNPQQLPSKLHNRLLDRPKLQPQQLHREPITQPIRALVYGAIPWNAQQRAVRESEEVGAQDVAEVLVGELACADDEAFARCGGRAGGEDARGCEVLV